MLKLLWFLQLIIEFMTIFELIHVSMRNYDVNGISKNFNRISTLFWIFIRYFRKFRISRNLNGIHKLLVNTIIKRFSSSIYYSTGLPLLQSKFDALIWINLCSILLAKWREGSLCKHQNETELWLWGWLFMSLGKSNLTN